jgi:hypothetical protein
MGWTYDPSALMTSPLYQVRLLIGDTNNADELLQDEEINFQIAQEGNIYFSAAACCRSLVAKFGRLVDKGVGSLHLSASQKGKQYAEMALSLRMRGTVDAGIFAGGLSIAGKAAVEQNSDRVSPIFTRDQFSPPSSSGSDDTEIIVIPLP